MSRGWVIKNEAAFSYGLVAQLGSHSLQQLVGAGVRVVSHNGLKRQSPNPQSDICERGSLVSRSGKQPVGEKVQGRVSDPSAGRLRAGAVAYYKCITRVVHVQVTCKEFVAYFRGMADKLSTRVTRSYTFTFDTEQEKADMLAHAKRRGTTLAALIKMLLATDKEKLPAKS